MKWWVGLLCVSFSVHASAQTHKDSIDVRERTIQRQSISLTKPFSLNADPKKTPFFCKQEVKLEKAVRMPVLIRVGSVADCNYLEQKPGYTLR